MYLLHWLQSGTLVLGLGGLVQALSRWAIWIGALGAAAIFLLAPRRAEKLRRGAFYALLAGVLALALAHSLAGAFVRPRPAAQDGTLIRALLPLPQSSSFPARASAFLFALAGGLFTGGEDAGVLTVLFGLLAALAEMAAGLAFPTDEIGGVLLGLSAAWAVLLAQGLFERPLRWLLRYGGWASSNPRRRAGR